MKSLLFKKLLIINCALLIIFSSCSVSKQVSKAANKILINDSVISTGHIGISIYEPATNKYWYNYDAAKYFVPASNTKLFTCYAGMKYLGDSLVGLRYYDADTAIYIMPTGDPTFLDEDFIKQPVLNFLKDEKRSIYIETDWREKALGKGWAWDDYNESFMAERSPFPIYGNVVKFIFDKDSLRKEYPAVFLTPLYFKSSFTPTKIPSFLEFSSIENDSSLFNFFIARKYKNNHFIYSQSKASFSIQKIPFCTDTLTTSLAILNHDFKLQLKNVIAILVPATVLKKAPVWKELYKYKIKSQPSDSLFKLMMHRSDNFFAEQTLLMVSNEYLGYMKDEDIIDNLLKTDLNDVPQKPKWVDGCGLSRYNLFTPQSFVYILNKMKNEFGLKRLEVILPTGGEGTLKNYYQKDSGYIYAKTGSMSNIVTLSGFLITQKNKLLIFSILTNNFQGDGTPVRRAIEQFLETIKEKY